MAGKKISGVNPRTSDAIKGLTRQEEFNGKVGTSQLYFVSRMETSTSRSLCHLICQVPRLKIAASGNINTAGFYAT
jgi:hypothetical protein